MNIAELLDIPASMFPDQEIVSFEDQRTTYEQLQDRVARTAGALQALGVRSGDRVAALQTNTPSVTELLYATTSLGAVFVPLNYRARTEELAQMLDVASPTVLLAGDRYLDLARGMPGRHTLVSLETADRDAPALEGLLEAAGPAVPEETADDALAVLLFTSGTTAMAKAVMLAHADLVNFVFNTTEMADGSDRGAVLVCAPLYHVAGLTAVLAATFAGRRMVVMRQFDAAEWLRLAALEQVTHAFLVPTMVKRALEHPTFAETDLSSLQVLSYGAAPMPLSLIRRAIGTFPPAVQFINAFGQTETTSTVTMLGPDDHRLDGTPDEVEKKIRRLASIGRPLPDVEVRMVDDRGEPVAAGQVGEIAIRTDRTMRGYYGQPDATQATLHDGWLHTRDLGWMDEDGYIFLVGRKSDMIIRGGENIAPEEIEIVLESHSAVEEAAVIGLPDEEWGERVVAVVVLLPGGDASEADLIDFCHERLASFKKPERIFFADALPRNALGKLVRREVRALYLDESGRSAASAT